MTETLSLLGSTGSVGTQTLAVCRARNLPVAALTANRNTDLLEQQIREFHPAKAALLDETAAADLKIRIADTDTRVLSGISGVCECAADTEADTVCNAIVGIAGLVPTLDAIHADKKIALANKESLVAGGQLVMDAVQQRGVPLLPVDSEHSAIWQCLQAAPKQGRALKKILLTASGGPFFGKTRAELEQVTVQQALQHPNWSMGAKITIDSATLMNKGLEIIEACWLFDVPEDKIEVLVHRESILHSAIQFEDNAVIGQLGVPDMAIPIQYALTYPERLPSPAAELDLTELSTLHFAKPDMETFDCLAICREAIRRGGLYPAAANSANEQANSLFRAGRISFLEIGELVAEAMDDCHSQETFTLSDVLAVDREARETVNDRAGWRPEEVF